MKVNGANSHTLNRNSITTHSHPRPTKPTRRKPATERRRNGITSKRRGDIPGYPAGSTFATRQDLSASGVHAELQKGIAGRPEEGVFSIVLSGGYEDDVDGGDIITYTGEGGRDKRGIQTTDQVWSNRANMALKIHGGISFPSPPIRVIRGENKDSKWAPPKGFRYDGLYRLIKVQQSRGKRHLKICQAVLRRIEGQPDIPTKPTPTNPTPPLAGPSGRRTEIRVGGSTLSTEKQKQKQVKDTNPEKEHEVIEISSDSDDDDDGCSRASPFGLKKFEEFGGVRVFRVSKEDEFDEFEDE